MNEELLWRVDGVMEARLSEDELVLLGPQAEDYVGLNAVAADVWARLETPATFEDLVAALVADYDAPAETIAEDLAPVIETLLDTGLVVRAPAS